MKWLLSLLIGALVVSATLRFEGHGVSGQGRISPNDGAFRTGVNAVVWQGDGGASSPEAVNQAMSAVAPGFVVDAIWSLQAGSWLYHLPASPAAGSLTSVPGIAALYMVLRPARTVDAETVPIIDLHFHPDPEWDLDGLMSLFDELRVAKAGNGRGGPDDEVLAFTAPFTDRLLPFAGQGAIRAITLAEGEPAWRLDSQTMLSYLDGLEEHLRARRFQGIGELFVDNRRSFVPGSRPSRYPADSLLMQRLFALSAAYGVPLSVHMDATEDGVAEMERLLASNRQGAWIWAHTGFYAEPALLQRLLQAHPNLSLELSYRTSVQVPRLIGSQAIDDNGVLKPEWRDLIEQHPDRFIIGTDIEPASFSAYAEYIRFWRRILAQLTPNAAAGLAHRGAERALQLPPN